MLQQQVRLMAAAISLACASTVAQGQTASYPFQNPALPASQRIANILSLMTVDEKIDALSTRTGVARLGIPSFGGSEGIHGLVQRGNDQYKTAAIATTQFPQPPGMGASWNPKLVQQAAAVQGDEGRYITHNDRYKRPVLMQWGPQADLARDPRWGRSEEVYSEDPFLAGTMSTAFVKGLKATIPSTGAPPPCSSTSSPTAMRMAAAIRRPISTSGCSWNTTRCRSK